jgi:hypothetical protein
MQISRQISVHCAGRSSRHISSHASDRSNRQSAPAKFRRHEPDGFIITLVAIFLLFVVGAMAALSIDVVTFYTARSEAQLAADAGALAGARVLANSGATSDSTDSIMLTNAQAIAGPVATQVAQSNTVGGLPPQSIAFAFSPCPGGAPPVSNPCVTVQVKTTVPVFFARIWGNTIVSISASATAEAYNPSGLATSVSSSQGGPIAPSCVKPWLLPNLDPNPAVSGGQIFDPTTGAILDSALLGMSFPDLTNITPRLSARCGTYGTPSCSSSTTPTAWQYFVGDDTSFPHPTQSMPVCASGTNFQLSIAGCEPLPIVCGSTSQVNVDTTFDATLDSQAAAAVDCLTHTSGQKGDIISLNTFPPTAFEFTTGDDNPIVQAGSLAAGKQTMVSDSLVTVPVFASSPTASVTSPVTVIGFLQLFLEPTGQRVPAFGTNQFKIRSKIINLVGCGTNSNSTTTPPIYGNGATAVPVRLISPP